MRRKTRKKKRIAGKLVLLLVVLLAAAALLIATHDWKEPVAAYETTNPYITPYGQTMVSAHRSGGGIFPENTMMAFEGCIESETFRTDIFEFDLHITKDGKLVILHDDTLDRTTNSEAVFGVKNARPEDYTLEELRQLNFGEGFTDAQGNAPYRGLTGDAVPDSLRAATLEQVLAYLENHGAFSYVIEIKNKKELGFAAADALYTVLNDMGLRERAIVGTFNAEVTAYLDRTYPDLIRSASIKEVLAFYFASLLRLEKGPEDFAFDALQIPANQFVIRLGTNRLVNYAHKNNLAVQYWTINDADDIRFLRDLGADCVMSDVPDVAYRVLNEEAE